MSEKEPIREEISAKLDTLIALLKIIAQDSITKIRKNVQEDEIKVKLLVATQEEISYTQLTENVAEELNRGLRTVKGKLAELRENGLVITERRGREVYYINAGLIGI